jgi:hypothetical protein
MENKPDKSQLVTNDVAKPQATTFIGGNHNQ